MHIGTCIVECGMKPFNGPTLIWVQTNNVAQIKCANSKKKPLSELIALYFSASQQTNETNTKLQTKGKATNARTQKAANKQRSKVEKKQRNARLDYIVLRELWKVDGNL